MNFSAKSGNVLAEPSELAMLAVFEGDPLPASVAELLEANDFNGRADQTLLLYPRGAVTPRRLLLVGLGKRENLTADTIRRAAATTIKQARELQADRVTMGVEGSNPLDAALSGQAYAEGAILGGYHFLHYQTNLTESQTFEVEGVTVYTASGNERDIAAGLTTGQAIANGVAFARDLVNRPGDAKTPAILGEEAIALGQRSGLAVTVLEKEALEEQGFGGILAVGQGSVNEPRFIVMEHGKPEDGPTVCLVGKGLTFDSGGLSLKPADAMETMKNDMGGAAAVYGAMQVVAELKLPLHVVGLVSSAENMPSGSAYRPGDILRTLSGKTIEVLNTDAEGRIILSDGLFYAQRYQPDAIVELSTLTGAIIIALGLHATGLMATDQALADKLISAGEATAERLWQLPLWPEYRRMVKSDIADIKNMAGRPAGSITAAAFLAEFVGDYPFAHLDIAGTAWADRPARPYESRGGTGVGVRLLTDFLRNFAR